MERPLVATDVPGCRDIVQNGITGFLCEPRDITSLIEAIERVIRLSVRQRADMGRAGRELVERKYSDNMVALVYEECLGKFGVILPT